MYGLVHGALRALVGCGMACSMLSCVESPSLREDALAGALRHIEEREYWASRTPEGLQAPNRRQNLRAWFDGSGIRVHDRVAEGSPRLVSLRLARMGRGASLASVGPGELSSRQGRVEIRRAGLVEWYVNSSTGIEQGFTLSADPAPARAESERDSPLVLELALDGATIAQRGDALELATASGRTLRYGHLVVRDARERVLAAAFEVPDPRRVHISVADRGAMYPIVIDPLLTATPDTQLSGIDGDNTFGWSVASAGDVNGDGYDDVIVGDYTFDAGQNSEGAAWVFLGSAQGIADADTDGAHAQLESNQANSNMGHSVAGAGDVNGDGYDDVIVGDYIYDSGLFEFPKGAAFVFLGSASGIADGNPATAHARLLGAPPVFHFGDSVASAGDVDGDGYGDVLVGAPSLLADETSAAFIFHGSPQGIPHGGPASAQTSILSPDPSGFGWSVASAGDVDGDGYGDVVVGAPGFDGGQSNEGAAYVFRGAAAGIPDGAPADAAARLESDRESASFGQSVAGAGDVDGDGYGDVIIGAPFYDPWAFVLPKGAAFVFRGSAQGIASGSADAAGTRLVSAEIQSSFGRSVASAGDVNDDGYADVVVGCPGCKSGAGNKSAAFVFLGSPNGIPSGAPNTAQLFLSLDAGGAQTSLGHSVASAGDVDGDGDDDVIVGAPGYPVVLTSEGAAFIYHGDVQIVPEPTHLALLAAGITLLCGLSRRRSRS